MNILKSLALLLLFVFVSCKKERASLVEPNETGNKVFEIVKEMNTISSAEYQNKIVVFDELKALGDDSSVPLGKYLRDDIKSITMEDFKKVNSKNYDLIKSQGIKYGIDWSKISFEEFKFDFQNIDGGKILLGETYFKNIDGKVYFVKSASFFDGKGYFLIQVAEIEPRREKVEF